MRRPVLYAFLSFLLLALQIEGLVHPFRHLDTRAARPDRVEAALPQAVPACVECALLVAGSDAVGDNGPSSAFAAPATPGALTAFHTRAVAAPVHFASRAPPLHL
jgi:hypothetical protein